MSISISICREREHARKRERERERVAPKGQFKKHEEIRKNAEETEKKKMMESRKKIKCSAI